MAYTHIFTDLINSYLPEPHASLLNGILFGTSIETNKELYEKFRMVGLLHIVVLSGMNITLLIALVTLITRYFSKLKSYLIMLLFIVFFVIFVGPKAPIIRAAIMGIITSVSLFFGKKTLSLYSLFLSVFIILIIWPAWLKTISLQLSYGATLGIILFAKTNNHNGFSHDQSSALSHLVKYIRENILISVSSQIFTLPLIFFHFRQISLIGVIANVFISWVIGPLMIFGFFAALLGKVHWILGLILSYICYGILNYIIIVVNVLSSIPFIFIEF